MGKRENNNNNPSLLCFYAILSLSSADTIYMCVLLPREVELQQTEWLQKFKQVYQRVKEQNSGKIN